MKKEYVEILTELCSNPGYYELDTFIGELRKQMHITPNDMFEIERQNSLSAKCLEDSVLGDIEEIFKRNNWTDGFQFIQLRRKETGDFMNSNNEKPFLFGVKKPTFLFTGRDEKIEQIHKIISQNIQRNYNHRDVCSIVISGLGGIGKTELILSYIHKFKQTFDSIVWINAESQTALTTSFNNLALELNITLEKLTFEAIAKKIAQKISVFGSKNLFVFDNADEVNPNEFLPPNFKKHFFLITSRHQCWKDSAIINLEALTEEEAVQFVEMSLEIGVKKMDGIREFVSTLEYFPLALRQATSYIKVKNRLAGKRQMYTFKEYVAELEANAENAKKLLSFLPKDVLSDGNSKTNMIDTITTWQLTFDKIKSMQHNQNNHSHEEMEDCEHANNNTIIESLPARILNISAYLLSDNIPTNLFLIAANQNEEQLTWALDILEKYSLITITQKEDESMMKVHKLVQQVTQLNLINKERSEDFVKNAADLLLSKFPLCVENLEAISVKRTLFPHLMHLKEYIANNIKQDQFFNIMCPLMNCIIDICKDTGEPNIRKNVSEELLSLQELHYRYDCPEIASTLNHLADAFGDLGDLQKMKSLLERALKIQESHYGPDHFQVAATLVNLARAFGHLGDSQTMKSLLLRALRIEESHYGPDHFEVAILHGNLANAFGDLGDSQMKKSLLERALKIDERRYGPDHFRVAITLVCLANAFGDLGDSQTKKSLVERALKIQEGHYGPDHFQVAITLVCLANAFGDLGDSQKMKSLVERALKIQENHYGPDHFQVAITFVCLANAFGEFGDSQTKKLLLERALKIQESHYGPDHFRVAITLTNLANAFGDLGESETKKSLLERALKIKESHYGPDHFQVAITLVNLANAFGRLGDSQTKKSLLERALKIEERHYGPDHFQVAITLVCLANAFGDLGNSQMKKSLLERALKIKEGHYDVNNYNIAITRFYLAECMISLKEFQDAKELLESLLPVFKEHYGNKHLYVVLLQKRLGDVCKLLDDSQTSTHNSYQPQTSHKCAIM